MARSRSATWGLVAGPLLALAVYAVLNPASSGLGEAGRRTAAIAVLMAVYWTTEALPLPVTSLLPLVLFPLGGVLTTAAAAAPYANPFVFLYLGGFILALAIEKWALHRRIALLTILAMGTRPPNMIAAFMVATAAISMWISNTATTLLMLPIGMSVVKLMDEVRQSQSSGAAVARSAETSGPFGTAMMLGIAYAASIGGIATLVGTPPNVFFAAFMANEFSLSIGFGQWMLFALPLSALMLAGAWALLALVLYPVRSGEIQGGRRLLAAELRKLGRVSRGEWIVLGVFGLTATLWIVRAPLTNWQPLVTRFPIVARLDDTVIAMAAAISLFAIPVDRSRQAYAMDWEAAGRIPWGVLLLFGGGLSLAQAVSASQLDQWIGESLARFEMLPPWGLVLVITVVVIFLTEVTSNTATAATLLPVLGGFAKETDVQPMLLLLPAVVSASCAFMLPVATPPNAIVFGSGQVRVGQMAAAGFWLNLLAIAVIVPMVYFVGGWIF